MSVPPDAGRGPVAGPPTAETMPYRETPTGRFGERGEPSMGDRAQHMAANVARAVRTPETKEFFKTSEFLVWFFVSAALLIAAGTVDTFAAHQAWQYVAIVSAAYILSRGISKAGTGRGSISDAPRPYDDPYGPRY